MSNQLIIMIIVSKVDIFITREGYSDQLQVLKLYIKYSDWPPSQIGLGTQGHI